MCFNFLLMHSHLQPDQLFTQYFPFTPKPRCLARWRKRLNIKWLWFNSRSSLGFILYSVLSDLLCPHWLYQITIHTQWLFSVMRSGTFSGENSYTLPQFHSGVKMLYCATSWGDHLMKCCTRTKLINRLWCCCVGGHMERTVNGELCKRQ